jgi:carboxyl-terminal processing protease
MTAAIPRVAHVLIAILGLLAAACHSPKHADLAVPTVPLAAETFDEVWKILHETHFDTNYNGHNWLQVREKYRPRAITASTSKALRDTIQEMLNLLAVSHLAIVPGDMAEIIEARGNKASTLEEADEEDSGTIGMEVRFSGTNLLVTRVTQGLPAAKAGIKPGWILRRIGEHQTARFKSHTPETLDERRRDFLAWRAASKKLSGRPASKVELEFLNGKSEPVRLVLQREGAQGEPIQFGTLPVLYAHLISTEMKQEGITAGVIQFNIWMLPTALAFNKAIDQHRTKDGIIIDLRGNIGGMVGMIIGVAGHFMDKAVPLGTLIARDNRLFLPANPRFVDSSGRGVEIFSAPVAILVDEITASASEVFTGGLQEYGRVRVFGRTTAGQALPAVYEKLPNGDALYHPVADFVTPKGTRFEGRGVIPDEAVQLSRPALLAGKDPVLERAFAWIASSRNDPATAKK